MSEAAPAIATSVQESPVPTAGTPAATPPGNASNDVGKQEAPAATPNDTNPVDPAAPAEDARDWFMRDKFATEVDQAKAYPELLKKMGKNWGAPKDDYSVEGIEGIVKDDPLLKHLAPALKELGLSQDGFGNLIKSYQDANIALGKAIEEQVKTELTQKDAQTVTAVDNWISKSFDEAQQKLIRSWIVSVDDFHVLNTLRVMMPQDTSVPSTTNENAPRYESVAEVENEKIKYRKEVAQGLRVEDKNFSNELQQRFKDAYTRENANKKK